MLTQRQSDLLNFIIKRAQSGGLAPTFEEMRVGIGLGSKSGIHRIIDALEERGFIRRLHNRQRAIEVLKMPGEEQITLIGNLEMVTACLEAATEEMNTTRYDAVIANANAAIKTLRGSRR